MGLGLSLSLEADVVVVRTVCDQIKGSTDKFLLACISSLLCFVYVHSLSSQSFPAQQATNYCPLNQPAVCSKEIAAAAEAEGCIDHRRACPLQAGTQGVQSWGQRGGGVCRLHIMSAKLNKNHSVKLNPNGEIHQKEDDGTALAAFSLGLLPACITTAMLCKSGVLYWISSVKKRNEKLPLFKWL